MHIDGQTVIRRSPTAVFDFVADERNGYDPQVRNTELLTGEPIGVGTRFRSESVSRGRPLQMIIEILDYDRPRRLVTSTHLDSMDINSTLMFESDGMATRLKWQSDLEPRGPLRLLSPLITMYGRRRTRAIWDHLKQALETDPDTPVDVR